MKHPAIWILAMTLLSCGAPQSEHPDSVPAPGNTAVDRVVGTVRVIGSSPVNVRVVVQPAEGKSIQIVGPMGGELRQLSGAEVALRGPIEPAPDPLADRQIRVEEYEIIAVNGEPVVTGTVRGRSGDLLILETPGGETVYLGGATSQLSPGQKVWVQGPRSVIVQSYGVLKP